MSAEGERLRRLWGNQLLVEYRQLCWLYRLPLAAPVFEISEGQRQAGAWAPDFDTLKIASWLIIDHSWDVVVEVLKHEVCHQYVHQVMGQGDEMPHGPAFLKACDRLGVHPEFRSATGSIPRLLKIRPGGAASSAILARVEKLFALAQSANEHEAVLAMEKANALLRKHNLERLASKAPADYDYLILALGGKRLSAHHRAIAAILKDFFYVNVVIVRRFEARSGESHRVIELTGARENLAVADYVATFLANRLASLWSRYRRQTGAPGRERNSYCLGVLNGFRAKLARQAEAAMRQDGGQEAGSLICANDPGLIRYYRARYPRLRKISHAGPQVHADSYTAGQEEGGRLILHRGVAAGTDGTGKPRLLDRG
ncbi:SprT-like domain-containing protein [Thiovibrio sp. JS02]